MKAEPGRFYLSVIDVFSIMLPGALLAFFLADLVEGAGLGVLGHRPGAELREWLIFLFPAYLYGHLIFLISSFLDKPYDKCLRRRCYPDVGELAYLRADAIKAAAIGAGHVDAINTFQWAKSLLLLAHPEASAEVSRLEASSKFFRSLVLVFLILAILGLVQGQWLVSTTLAALMLLCLWRYVERRHKSVKQACWFVIALEGAQRKEDVEGEPPATAVTHAGGVVYRMQGETVEYLLVSGKSDSLEWLLPKGHIEPGESRVHAAEREVREESGVNATAVTPVGRIRFATGQEQVVADYYLMRADSEGTASEPRHIAWLAPADALEQLSFADHRYLLAVAEEHRAATAKPRRWRTVRAVWKKVMRTVCG